MGIPRFFSFISKNFGDLIKKYLDLPEGGYVDGVYIDLNSVIHQIAQVLFKYGLDRLDGETTENDEWVRSQFRKMGEEARYQYLYRLIGEYIIHLYDQLKPVKKLMIAADGVAPKAKMVQQRKRRFSSKGPTLDFFDSVMISAGTPFMDGLDRYLLGDWATAYKDHFHRGLSIVYSGHREAGEGEHKIFDQINSEKTESKHRRVHRLTRQQRIPYSVVVGADSDLIVIASSSTERIIFMRDAMPAWDDRKKMTKLEIAIQMDIWPESIKQWDNPASCTFTPEEKQIGLTNSWKDLMSNGFSYLDIDKLKKVLNANFLRPNDIFDFSVLTFFLGNDFIPSVPEMEVVVDFSNARYTENDIFHRYRDLYYRGDDGKYINKKKKFDAKRFSREFTNLSKTWTKYNKKPRALRNHVLRRFEIFPWIPDNIPVDRGTPRSGSRYLRYKPFNSKEDKWYFERVDNGSLITALRAYAMLMEIERKGQGGTGSTFLVENRQRLNYINLAKLLKILMANSADLMRAHLSQHHLLTSRGRIPNPTVMESVGKLRPHKKGMAAIVSASFRENHNLKAFGIYDSHHADTNLPKRAVDEMCRKWLEGVQWTLSYYASGYKSVDTRWFYPFEKGPSIIDLYNYITKNIVRSVPAFPDIYFSPETDRTTTIVKMTTQIGLVFKYTTNSGKEIGKISGTDIAFLDMEQVEIITDRSKPRIDPSKYPLLVTKTTEIDEKVQYSFPMGNDIFRVISIDNPYATTIESFFSILPVRVLKLLLPEDYVEEVIESISDAFPETFVIDNEGKFYSGQEEPVVPRLSMARVIRAIGGVSPDPETEAYLKTLTKVHARKRIIHNRYKLKVVIEDIKPVFRF